MRTNPVAQCAGKVGFTTYTLAQEACHRRHGREVYHCCYCKLWHVGSASRPVNKKKEQRCRP
jgi:hypothetical protein